MTKSFLSRAISLALSSGRPVSCLTLALGGSLNALAQDRTLEEIVVTTERRAATQAVTAISMEVLSADDLGANDIKDLIDLQNAVSNVQFNNNGLYSGQPNIRGVGNPSTGGPLEQVGIPTIFDGAWNGDSVNLGSGFFDIADVQILRGPQATFIGQSAVGGAILVNSARPNFEGLNGFVEATVGDYERRQVTGALNLPIKDTLAARIAFMSGSRGSHYSNVSGQFTPEGADNFEPGAQDDAAVRIGLLWEPSDQLSVYSKLEWSRLDTDHSALNVNPRPRTGFDPFNPTVLLTSYAPFAQGPEPGTGVVEFRDHDGNPFTPPLDFIVGGTPGPNGEIYDPLDPRVINQPYRQYRIEENTTLTVEVNYELDSGMRFRSLSSYLKPAWRWSQTPGSSVYQDPVSFNYRDSFYNWVQDFNIISPEGQRVEWLAGIYRNERETSISLITPFANPNGPTGLPCGWQFDGAWRACPTSGDITNNLYANIYSTTDLTHTGAYFQLDWNISDTLELAIGARHNDDDQVSRGVLVPASLAFHPDGPWAALVGSPLLPAVPREPCTGFLGAEGFICPVGIVGNLNHPTNTLARTPPGEETTSTYKVGLNWEPVDGHFFYAFYARGYKASQARQVTEAPVLAEIVDDYELGWKGTFGDGRIYAEFGVFQMDYENMQMSAFQTGTDSSSGGVRNLGDSDIQGAEGSIRAFFGNLGVSASFGYTESELGEITVVNEAALPFSVAPGQVAPGDVNLGCTGLCFDYAPYEITLSGSENLFGPKLTYTMALDYQFSLRNGGALTPRVSLNHSDETVTDILQLPGDTYYNTEKRDIVNVSLTYEKDDWSVQAFVNNVTDELFIEGVAGDAVFVVYGDPRTAGVRIGRSF
jgi:iron complex outermembrane recepter protein